MKLKRYITLVLVLLLLTGCGEGFPAGGFAVGSAATSPSGVLTSALPEEIIIGWYGPRSGILMEQGIASLNGAKLAVAKINAEGGVNGRNVRIVARDNLLSQEDVLKAVKELCDKEGAHVIIGAPMGDFTLQGAQYCEDRGILHIATGRDGDVGLGGESVLFRSAPAAAADDRSLAAAVLSCGEEIISGVVSESFAQYFAFDGFSAEAAKLGLNAGAFAYEPGKSWEGAAEAAVKDGGAIALYCAKEDIAGQVVYLRKIGYTGPVFAAGSAMDAEAIDALIGDEYGVVFAKAYLMPRSVEMAFGGEKEFATAYMMQYGKAPGDEAAYSAYDAVMMACRAISAAGSTEGVKAAEALEEAGYTGTCGRFDFNKSHLDPVAETKVYMLKKGKIEILE